MCVIIHDEFYDSYVLPSKGTYSATEYIVMLSKIYTDF